MVVRRSRHGGLLGPIRDDRFFGATRGPRELEISLTLRRLGVASPEIVAYATYPAGPMFRRANVVSREVPRSLDLAAALAALSRGDSKRLLLEATGKLLASMSLARARHPDLNIKNVLVAHNDFGGVESFVLDVDRVWLDKGGAVSVLEANMRRLSRSALKWRRLHGAAHRGGRPARDREHRAGADHARSMSGAASGRRICIVMMSAIGDAVHVLPVVTALKRHDPDAKITWILQPGPASLVRGHPDLDEILIFENGRGLRGMLDLRAALAQREFDLVIDLQVYIKAGLVTSFTRASVKLGFDKARARDMNWLFTTQRIPPHASQHVQDQYLEFLAALRTPAEPLEWQLGPWPGELTARDRVLGAFPVLSRRS